MNNEVNMADRPENKMGTKPIGKLLFFMSIPAIFSMLIQSIYNVVDSMYVARINLEDNNAINALSLAFPIQMLMMAIALGIGVGTNSAVARRLGAKKRQEASNIAKTGLILALSAYLVVFALGWIVPQAMAHFLEKDPIVEQMIVDYLSVAMIFSGFIFVEMCATKILQATGNMIVPMIAQLIGAITNIILDPIFIFGKGTSLGNPQNFFSFSWGLGMGVRGAAIATVIAQGVAMVFVLLILFLNEHEIDFSFKKHAVKKQDIKEILKVGFPVMVMNSIGSLTIFLLNTFINRIDDGGEGILGVYIKLQSFVFMPVFGLSQGAMPIMGYNYGANNKERFQRALKLTAISSLSIITVGFLIFQFLPHILLIIIPLAGPYNDLAKIALRIISISFLPAALNITVSVMFQAIGQGFKSMMMSLLRQLVIIVPFAYVLSLIFPNLSSIWICYPISEFFALLIFVPIGLKTVKKAFENRAAAENLAYLY